MPGNKIVPMDVQCMTISLTAADMARRLMHTDLLFTTHPLSNSVDGWQHSGAGAVTVDPWRQLIAYGLGEIQPTKGRLGDQEITWCIVLTERGRWWVRAGCPLDIQPPSSGQHNRRRRAA